MNSFGLSFLLGRSAVINLPLVSLVRTDEYIEEEKNDKMKRKKEFEIFSSLLRYCIQVPQLPFYYYSPLLFVLYQVLHAHLGPPFL